MAKDIIYGEDARKALQAGIDKLANTVKMMMPVMVQQLLHFLHRLLYAKE